MDPVTAVIASGGLAHRAVLRALGASARSLRADLDSGRLVAIGRDRVAVPECDPALVRAAEAGGRLACISAAAHRGLWTLDDGRVHITAAPTASRLRLDSPGPPLVVHWGGAPLPTPRTLTIEPLENMLLHIARCQRFDLAVATVDSAINSRLISQREIQRLGEMQGGAFRAVAASADGRADSGLESLVRIRMAALGVVLRPQVVLDGHAVDGLIGERLVIQIDGYEWHASATQRRRDLEQDARLAIRGHTVLRFDFKQIVRDWDYVERTILAAMAQGLHLGNR